MKGKHKLFYKEFLALYVVLVLQNIVTLSVNLADNMMLGAYSEVSLSGVAAVNQVQFVFQQILMALGDGVVILGSQYWGKGQTKPMKKITSIAMRMALIVAVALFFVVSMFPGEILRLFTGEAAIVQEGVCYLNIIRFTYLSFAITQILLAMLRSTGVVRIAFWLSVETLVINCAINFVLIYGRFGAPEMGTAGAAVGTLVARIVEMLVLIVYIIKKETKLKICWKDFLRFDKVLFKDYIKLTTPMLVIQGLWGMNTALQTVILGHMTAAAIAANSVASTLFLLVKSTAVGAASAASVMIGKAIGGGNVGQVKEYAKILQKTFVVIGVLAGTTLFFLRIPILQLYDLSPATKEMANAFLVILSVVCMGMSYQMPTNIGLIRGGGSASFVVKVDLISIWGIVIPLSLIMAFVVEASPIVVVCCLNADQIFKCIPAFIKVNYGNWIRKLTREQEE